MTIEPVPATDEQVAELKEIVIENGLTEYLKLFARIEKDDQLIRTLNTRLCRYECPP